MESRKIYERCYLIQKPLSFGQINCYFSKPVANAISNKALSNKTFRFSNMPQFEKCLGNFYFYSKEKRIIYTVYSKLSAQHARKTIMIKTATFCD